MQKSWESYEQVAAYLLNRCAEEFGLEGVQGKQKVPGQRSGTEWEIDAKGVLKENTGFIIVECKRHVSSKLDQGTIGSLAYKILDTGAGGGIIVSPLELQDGARMVAGSENIVTVRLDQDSTCHEYILRFLNKIKVGVADRLDPKDSVKLELGNDEGSVIY